MNNRIEVELKSVPFEEKGNLWTVYNFKGGVGKTLVSANIASMLRNTLVVDLDSQCSLTANLNGSLVKIMNIMNLNPDNEDDEREISEIKSIINQENELDVVKLWSEKVKPGSTEDTFSNFCSNVNSLHLKTEVDGISLLRGSNKLFDVEAWLGRRWQDMRDRYTFIHTILKFARLKGFDNVLVDLSPGENRLNWSILSRSSKILCPTFLDYTCIFSVKSFLEGVLNRSSECLSDGEYVYATEVGEPHVLVLINKYKKVMRNQNGNDLRVLVKSHRIWKKLLMDICDVVPVEYSAQFESGTLGENEIVLLNTNLKPSHNEKWKLDDMQIKTTEIIDWLID